MGSKSKQTSARPIAIGSAENRARDVLVRDRRLILTVLLGLFTLLLYWPSYRTGYLWDDQLMLGNPLIQSGWAGLRDIWLTTKFKDFVPLTVSSFWLEWHLGGVTPQVRHATNILLQAANVVLVWRVLRRLKIQGSWMAAAIFAAHPLCVTSVTWIAERKNALSMLFYLLSLLCFLRSGRSESPPAEAPPPVSSGIRPEQLLYGLSFLFYVAALLSKTSVVVLPMIFLLCAWWQRGRISRQDIWRTAPFFGIALAAGVTTVVAHYYLGPKLGGMIPVTDSLPVRLFAASRAVWFYLGKGLLPVGLTMHYPRWEINPGSPLSYLPGMAILAMLALCWRFRQSWGRACLFGLGYFVLALAPTLGLLKMTYLTFSQVADHFTFLALPGLIALLVGGVCALARRAPRPAQYLTRGLFLLLALPLLIGLSWGHQRRVGDAEALWQDNVGKYPQSWVAHNNLGKLLAAQGGYRGAEEHYRAALAVYPGFYDIHNGLGVALMSQGKFGEAVGTFTEAIRLAPGYALGEANLALALMKLGRREEALVHLREVVRLEPDDAGAESNLGLALSEAGRPHDALEHYRRALQLAPADKVIRDNFGFLLAAQGQYDEALSQFAGVARLQPDDVQAHTGMANVLGAQGKAREAAAHSAIVCFLLGRQEANKNHLVEARRQFQKALQLDAAATIEFSDQVCTPSAPNSVAHLALLAASCAEARRFADATNTLQKAVALAEATGQTGAATECRGLLEQYRREVTRQ